MTRKGSRVPPVAQPAAPKKPTVFDTINALSSVRPLSYRDITEQNFPYEPFLINRAFSLSEDAVLAAAQLNLRPDIPKDMHATYLVHTLRPRRRFEKWPKSLEDAETTLIAHYYGMSKKEAKLHLRLHTKEELERMQRVIDDGARPSRTTIL